MNRTERDPSPEAGLGRKRHRTAVAAAVLIGLLSGALVSAAVFAGEVWASAAPLAQDDEGEPAEAPPTTESEEIPEAPEEPSEGEEPPDETAPEESEPELEPRDVPGLVWIAAGALVIAAIIWGVTIGTGD